MNNYGLREEDWSRIVGILSDFDQIDEAILYGSRAVGTFRPQSDIDICLIGQSLDLTIINNVTFRLDDLMLPQKIDIAIYHQITNPDLIDNIDRQGVKIYIAKKC